MSSLWSNEENEALLHFLFHNRSRDSFGSAMFGHGFIWNEVAKSLPRRPGIRRSAMACCNKWRWMKECYAAISDITERFGWDDQLGANIGDDSKRWEIFLTERMSISGPKLIRAASQFRNSGWNLLEKVTRVIEGPGDEPEEEIVVRRPKRKLIPEVVIIRQPEHDIFRRHLASIKASEPCKPKPPKFKFKEELDPEISLFTPPPPNILLDGRNSEIPVTDFQDFPQRTTKHIQSDSETSLPLRPAKRLRHSSPLLNVRLDSTIEDSVTLSNPVPADTDLSVRKSRMAAILRVQALETQLSDRCIVALVDLFETKAEAADVYLSLTRESVRKQWVAIRVKHVKEQEEREGLTS